MENERKIEVEFESTEKDFRRVLLWYHWKRMFLEYSLMIIIGIPLCYFLGFNVLDFANNSWATFTFLGTLTFLLMIDIYRRCFYQANKLKEITKPAKSIFTEKGVESKTSVATSNRDWESYLKVFETKTDLIFFSQENFFATIPKRFFKSNEEIEDLRELIKRKLGKKAKLQN